MNPLNVISSVPARIGSGAGQVIDLARRTDVTARNVAEYLRYGGLEIDAETSTFDVVAAEPVYRLRHYFADESPTELPVLLLVPPLMMATEVYDVAPASSSVRAVHECGIDVWVVDFGRPEHEAGGLERTMGDHVLAVSDAVDKVRAATGRDVVLSGYSQGGLFAYQAAAYRRGDGIDSLVTFGAPVDFQSAPLPIPISMESYAAIAEALLETKVLDHVSLPSWFNKTWTRMLDPMATIKFKLNYYLALSDRDKLLPGEQQRQFLENEGWTAWSGPAIREFLQQALVMNRMLSGGLVIGDRTVSLADIDCPIMIAVGEVDKEGHPLSVRGIKRAAPRASVYELTLRSGHFGIVAGAGARKRTWPRVAEWIEWRAGKGDLPAAIVPSEEVTSDVAWTPGDVSNRVRTVMDLGIGTSSTVIRAANSALTTTQAVVRERGSQVPLLNRLDGLKSATEISIGLLLDESAKRNPDGIALMFGDRVIRHRELADRIDAVVKGLISLGVRQGDRVGVMMSARPSSLALVAAVSRLGATSVLLRPERDVGIQSSAAGGFRWLVTDPERVQNEPIPGVQWCVLGGGGQIRSLADHVVDMERIDPDEVPLPAWYQPNPCRGSDVAFVLFTGDGADTRTRLISNRRWALSALGTASAAALRPADTMYSRTPLHHPSALLMAVGGAIAAGSRLAFASAPDRDTFWEEVSRYGATHVSYTWTSLREIASGPRHPYERESPIRLFIGSGMPHNLWRRMNERFAPARVLEFYASPDGEAILANVSATKTGCVGRPLPGTAEVRVAKLDRRTRQLAYGSDGLARRCAPGEAGLLLARSDPRVPSRDLVRGVFAANDSWQLTGDVFTEDPDGDLWFIDRASSLIETADGPVSPTRVQNALGRVSSVDVAVAYGVPGGSSDDAADLLVAAISPFPGATVTRWELESTMRRLDRKHRPHTVAVVKKMELSTWARPLTSALPQAIPMPQRGTTIWRLDSDSESYVRAR
ncbi:AMP-binding protein [Gordonia sp. PKS22-38]|uniref:AMP-binding protein n=1 Tax=Gordonia prachuapensis TaxID=3115651 RepID=A0ABU7MTS7_9ACTN|nr:AMP-binding protein [Gordonia sp. PKS22-38]